MMLEADADQYSVQPAGDKMLRRAIAAADAAVA